MTISPATALWRRETYDLGSLDDELRVDRSCGELLQVFRDDLLARGHAPLEAGALARGADYFLRDFVVDDRRRNLFDVTALQVRQFAGNWYIVRTLEPNLAELSGLLRGVAAFYAFAARNGAFSGAEADAIAVACADEDYYAARIDAFWAIEGAGYAAWESACTLKE